MNIKARYSHLNGEEFLRFRHPELWDEIHAVIKSVDAAACRTKQSREKRKPGRLLYSPVEMNKQFRTGLKSFGWQEQRSNFYVTEDEKVLRSTIGLPASEQRQRIEAAECKPISSYNQTDFVKQRVAVEVQFGKYAFVAHDLFVKHMSFFVSGDIDLGIEILPMKALEKKMSSGVPYYERDLLNVLRQGRGVPAVPLIIFGIVP